MFRKSDRFDKYRMYRNCFAIPKFPEIREITRKLRKETAIPVQTSKFLHIHNVRHIHDVAYMNRRRLYGTHNLRTLTGISGVLTRISVSFQNFRVISGNFGNSGNFVLISDTISVKHFH